MNYQHAYHVGHISDVFKHVILIQLLQSLHKKPTSFHYIETHAGKALYDLKDTPSQKTSEYQDGITKLWQQKEFAHPAIAEYMKIILRFNLSTAPLRFYPGSGLIARQYLREQDEAILCELNPPVHRALKEYFKQDKKMHVHERDGYEALAALIPPKTNRGLVLIDPPYELGNEYELILNTLTKAKSRWQNGMYAIWFPIKEYKKAVDFYGELKGLEFNSGIVAEFWECQDLFTNNKLRGSGLAILNAPWQFDTLLADLLPKLAASLNLDTHGKSLVQIL